VNSVSAGSRSGSTRPAIPSGRLVIAALVVLTITIVLAAGVPLFAGGQLTYAGGQNVVPVFEGWERNADGSFNMLFGYFSRNREEVVDIPIGPDNHFDSSHIDRGQPTRFYPSRNRYWFRVRVPADFGAKELVWTLTSRGKTERAYATLHPNYVTDASIQQLDVAGINLWWAEEGVNARPTVRIEGEAMRRVRVGQPLQLVAIASDDGIPPAPRKQSRRGRYAWHGLRVAWFADRAAGVVTFDPAQFKVYPDPSGNSPWTPGWTAPPVAAGGRYPLTASFDATGDYVLRVMAHDGGLDATADVHVIVE
jgi:hypothetical protein